MFTSGGLGSLPLAGGCGGVGCFWVKRLRKTIGKATGEMGAACRMFRKASKLPTNEKGF